MALLKENVFLFIFRLPFVCYWLSFSSVQCTCRSRLPEQFSESQLDFVTTFGFIARSGKAGISSKRGLL
jgi:hypothetical protein